MEETHSWELQQRATSLKVDDSAVKTLQSCMHLDAWLPKAKGEVTLWAL